MLRDVVLTKEENAKLRWVGLASSTDPCRPILEGFNTTEGHLVATDGHRAHFTKNLDGLPKGPAKLIGYLRVADRFTEVDTVDTHYPAVHEIIPAGEPPEYEASVNAKYLGDVLGGMKDGRVRLSFHKDKLVVRGELADGSPAYAMVMLMKGVEETLTWTPGVTGNPAKA